MKRFFLICLGMLFVATVARSQDSMMNDSQVKAQQLAAEQEGDAHNPLASEPSSVASQSPSAKNGPATINNSAAISLHRNCGRLLFPRRARRSVRTYTPGLTVYGPALLGVHENT